MNPIYVQTVNLLLDIAPTVFQTPRFAMKGGTALNLFVQDLPRLSVDIDVVFINHQADRDNALKEIAQELQRIETAIARLSSIALTILQKRLRSFCDDNNISYEVMVRLNRSLARRTYRIE